MKIQAKIIIVFIPLLIASQIITVAISYLSARNSITGIATEYLNYKLDELEKYTGSQWDLLVANELEEDPYYINIAKTAIEAFARTQIRKDSEFIFALDSGNEIDLATSDLQISRQELEALNDLRRNAAAGWQEIVIAGEKRVSQATWFGPFGWYIFVTDREDVFYGSVSRILNQNVISFFLSILVSVVLLVLFTRLIIKPVKDLSAAMEEIIRTTDLRKRVRVLYDDETGRLGHNFNIMIGQLDNAWDHIREFAHKAVIAKSKETYIRNIFQKYVPRNVVDQFYSNPDVQLIGEESELAVLFADVRGFSRMLDNLKSYEVVSCLSDYFELMVKIIMSRSGIVDKYIGDRLLAFFGAPVKDDDDVCNSVLSAFDMINALDDFNTKQKVKNLPRFEIGLGISYGKTIVGNIGSDMKMDYTIVGNTVFLAARLEELTKIYRQPVIIDEDIFRQINSIIPCRMLDTVYIGKLNKTMKIYAPSNDLSEKEKLAWKYHREGLISYYGRDFDKAREYFVKVKEIISDDECSSIFIKRCDKYIAQPPPGDWEGVEEI